MSHDWRSGTPSIGEWNGAWRANASEGEVSQTEWQTVWASLDQHLTKCGKNGFDDESDFFLRSTWFREHRSQVVEIVNPRALTLEFLTSLQDWMMQKHPNWRVIIPLFLGETNVLVVYPQTIRGGIEFEPDWGASLACARQEMLQLEQYKHIK
jgi:hypothetical protein